MSFFSSKTTTKSKSSYDNPLLKEYLATFQGSAPWAFASMDPDATLAAMGQGTTVGGKDLGAGMKAKLQGMSDQEKMQTKASDQALQRIQERQKSGKFLTPQETDFINQQLDKAFESSRAIAYEDWTRGAQMLAGSRGLRMSDTPIADPAMRSLRDMELGFSSQRAGMGLDATMQLSQRQQQFDADLMNNLNNLQFNRWNARQNYLFGGGAQAVGNQSYTQTGSSTAKKGMSGLEKITGTMGMLNKGLELAGSFAGMGSSLSSWMNPSTLSAGGGSSVGSSNAGINWTNPGDFRMQGVP